MAAIGPIGKQGGNQGGNQGGDQGPGTLQRRTARLVGATIVAGVAFIVALWVAVFLLVGSEQRMAMAHAATNVSNLSAAFEEEVGHELDTISGAMDLVAERMRAAPGNFDIYDLVHELPLLVAPAVQAVIIGPDGRLVSSTREPHSAPKDLHDRQYFRVQQDSSSHGLFISKPTAGRTTGQVTIKISRRVDAADGRFLGVVVFSVAPAQFTTLHRAIDLGPGGMFALFGTDNIVRARFSADSPDGTVGVGEAIPPLAGRADTGRLRDLVHVGTSRLDHVARIYSDRRIPGYPLLVGVGLDLSEALAPVRLHAWQIKVAAVFLSILLCGLLAALVAELRQRARHEVQLTRERAALAADIALRQQVERRLRESEQKFQDIAEVSGDWIWETDAAHRFSYVAAEAYTEQTGLHPEGLLGKTRWELAKVDPEQDNRWRQHKAQLDAHQPFRTFRYSVLTTIGAVRHFVVSGKPVFGADGTFLGYRGTANNETPRMEALQRAEQAETLLRDAMDSLSEGFVIFDQDDRLVLCNEAYRRMYPASARLMVPGVKFETLVRNTLTSGHYPDAEGREEEWVQNFLRIHNEAVDELETQQQEGRWILVSERRMRNGGLAGLRMDITDLKRIQGALHDSERRLRDFAEMASDWFWEQDADANFSWVSEGRGATPMAERPYLGKPRWAMFPDGATPEQWEAHKADIAAQRPIRDFRYRRDDSLGRPRHISIHGVPVYDASGAFTGYRGIGRDITEQIESEQELERAKERAEQAETLLRDAVDSISEGFVIFDAEDRLVMFNEVYRQIYADVADVLRPGLHFETLLRSIIGKGSNLEARGREEEWLAERMRQHREARGASENQRANGAAYLATDRRMKNGGIAGLRIDITALKQAQAALSESEERLDRAQAIAGIGSWELDVATKCYVWSKELYRLRGLDPETFRPDIDSVSPYIHPDDYSAAMGWLDQLMAGAEPAALEPRMVRPDGEVRVLRVEGRPVRDANGVVRRVAGTMQDVTERRLIERQLAQAQKMEAIGNLTGGMAHDFNNVLGVIIGNLDLLRRLIGYDETAAELCGEALDGATRCADLIRRLLAFARRQSLHPERTDVNALVGEVARLLGRVLGEDISLNLHLDAGLRPVMADPAQLEAALVNFATNARDAMPKGGRLDITTSGAALDAGYAALHPDVTPGKYVSITISDTGCGIAPQIIGRIFEPFFTTKEPGKGTGLGLSMAFGFAKQSGGHLAVYSEPGLGTTFRLYLPIHAEGAPAPAAPDTSAVLGGNETVLVVEDNDRLRQATVRQLVQLGYQVLEAEHADAALAMLNRRAAPDLLFSDVVMPGSLDGVNLAHRATLLRPGLKVLLTSGFPGVRGAGQAMLDCPFPMLTKPYRHDDLARRVREVLDADAGRFAWLEAGSYSDSPADQGERV
jgi:PAS domain S-box-containing protein